MKLLIADPFGLGTVVCAMKDTRENREHVAAWFQMNRHALNGQMNEDYTPLDLFLRDRGVELFQTHWIRPESHRDAG